MYKIGFDNDKYLSLQSEKIKERIAKFGGKLYLEFGGKLLSCIPRIARFPSGQQDQYAGTVKGRGRNRHRH